MIGHHTRFRENGNLPWWWGSAVKKKPPVLNVHVLMTREVMCRRDAQCNTRESPSIRTQYGSRWLRTQYGSSWVIFNNKRWYLHATLISRWLIGCCQEVILAAGNVYQESKCHWREVASNRGSTVVSSFEDKRGDLVLCLHILGKPLHHGFCIDLFQMIMKWSQPMQKPGINQAVNWTHFLLCWFPWLCQMIWFTTCQTITLP